MTTSGQTGRLFVGRHQEMTELNAALDDAVAGRGRLVMLAGEPGIAQEISSRALTLGGSGPLGMVLRAGRRSAVLALGPAYPVLRKRGNA